MEKGGEDHGNGKANLRHLRLAEGLPKKIQGITDGFLSVNCPDYTRDISIKDIPIVGLEDEKTAMDRMVEQQLKKWRSLMEEGLDVFHYGLEREKVKGGPVITISREPGSGGSEIARKLARDLSMDLMGGHIIQYVAESAKIRAGRSSNPWTSGK